MTKEQLFWDWFIKNESNYFFLNQINDDNIKKRLLDDFLSHLHEYCNNLYFEIGGFPDKKQDLIITAEGDTNFFEKVEALVIRAPQLEHWNVIAFKPIIEDFITECRGLKLDPKNMYFIPLNNNNSEKLGVRIYINNYNSAKKEDFLFATYLVLDNILGEKSNALDVSYVEIENLPTILKREGLIELVKLPHYIKWEKSKK